MRREGKIKYTVENGEAMMYEDEEQRLLAIDISNASSTSLFRGLLIKEIIYYMKSASQGSVRGPLLVVPNSCFASINSSLIMSILRYSKGRTKRLWSTEYTTKWPFSVIADVLQLLASTSLLVLENVILLRLMAASFCHFLANLTSFFAVIVMVYSFEETKRLMRSLGIDAIAVMVLM